MKAIRHIRYRQILLLVALILPTLGIFVAGREILEDDKSEIQSTLKKASEAIRGATSLVLEGIKTQEIASSSTGNSKYSDPAVLLVGSVVQSHGREYPDWTPHLKAPQIDIALRNASQVVREMESARSFEIARDIKQAVSHYRTLFHHLDELSPSGDTSLQHAATKMAEELKGYVAQLELASRIEAEFSSLNLDQEKWKRFDEGIWLSLTPPTGAALQPLVIAVRREDIVERVKAIRRANENPIEFELMPSPTSDNKNAAQPADTESQFLGMGNGNDSTIVIEKPSPDDKSIGRFSQALGDQFPGFDVEVLADDQTMNLLQRHRLFYSVLLALYLSVPILGWYLMLRDSRNERRIAEMRSQFVSNVSHELRTPLTSILLFAETMRMRGLTNPRQVAEHLDTIISQSERLTRLLNNVLNFSRIERGQADYHMKLTRMDEVVRSTARTMEFPLAEQGFNLKVDICCDLPPMRADGDALEQAILNLITNAMKYSGKSRDITLRLDTAKGNALIQVVDHGIGIAPKEQKRIFEKFYRVESLESSAISGVGIGLALVAHIARGHGGSVEVQSDLGKGSKFTIYIPIRENRKP